MLRFDHEERIRGARCARTRTGDEPGGAIALVRPCRWVRVNAAYKALVDKGLVVDGALSDAGFEALAPFKVDNAIILAAGLSSRFAPISYEKPKVCCMFVERF